MGENVKSDRPISSAVGSRTQQPVDTTASQAAGGENVGRRIDGAHTKDQPPEPPAGISASDQELLLQASQIAEHVQSQFSELNRREQSLNTQLSQLDQEQRRVRFWVSQSEDEIHSREEKLGAREYEFKSRVASCEKLAIDLEEQQQALVQAREELTTERTSLKGDLARELEQDRLGLQEAQTEAEAERSRLQIQIEQNQQAHDVAMQEMQQHLKAELERLRLQNEEEVRSEREAFAQQKQKWETLRDGVQAELEQQKVDQKTELLVARKQFEQEQSKQEAELKQERVLLENRIRFQQDHLTKARTELEQTQTEFRVELQKAQSRFANTADMLRLRMTQLDHYRSLLEERESSVERERELLAKSRCAIEDSFNKDKSRLQEERETWENERLAQRAEIRRQQNMLSLHAENLEGRRTRLDRLRAELEETHHNTLEMRMGVEEAWVQLSQADGEEAAKERLDSARQALSNHYRHVREDLSRQRHETEGSQNQFQEQKDEFREERQTLTDWVAERDEKLRIREQSLCRQADNLDTREAVWRATQEKWMGEKIEAETIIRSLLEQLTVLNNSPDDLQESEEQMPPMEVDETISHEGSIDRSTEVAQEGQNISTVGPDNSSDDVLDPRD